MEETTDKKPNLPPKTKRRAPRNGKRGRPQGSANRSFAEVLELPATCPACGSTDLKPIAGKPLIVRDATGTINGHAFDTVEWRDTQCQCGQHVRVRRYRKK